MKKYSYEEALHRAATLCSMTEKSETDIHRKLLEWGLENSDCERILLRLKKENFLNEERFATAFVKDKFCFSQWGRLKITYALRQKEISEQFINEALSLIDEDEYIDSLLTLLRGKKKNLKSGSDYEKSAKLIRFAQSRGFELNVILKVLKQL